MGIKQLLNIPKGYKIIGIEMEEMEMNVRIEPYRRKKGICSGCGEEHDGSIHSTQIVKARDLPIVGRKVYLLVKKRKYRCPKDDKIYVEEIEWLKKKVEIPKDLLMKYIV
jgi:transposase